MPNNNININKPIDKAQQEAARIQTEGVKSYLWNKKTSMSIATFLIVVGVAFILGAIVF